MTNSFKVGDFIISFEGDPLFDNVESFPLSITYQKPNDILTFLSSNFDSTQSFFEILDKKDKLERENQELKDKQALKDSRVSNTTLTKTDSTSDSIMQELLKDSQKNKDN